MTLIMTNWQTKMAVVVIILLKLIVDCINT